MGVVVVGAVLVAMMTRVPVRTFWITTWQLQMVSIKVMTALVEQNAPATHLCLML